jgi:DNA polymerase III subunit delta'
MADEQEDPREIPWHPRFAAGVIGHDAALSQFMQSFASDKPHHAWMITGSMGIGKATLAYHLARAVLAAGRDASQVERWVHARAHPDLVVLERQLNDAKPKKKLKSEIAVDDARSFIDFFARTSGSGGWRIGLVDAADDLNSESANALLKLVEEPPAKCLILLVCHAPSRVLRTLRSRCRKLPLSALSLDQTAGIVQNLQLSSAPDPKRLAEAISISGGSPGFTLQIVNSAGAKAFHDFVSAKRLDAPMRAGLGNHFASRAAAQQDFEVFMDLLLEWLAGQAAHNQNANLAKLHADLAAQRGIVSGYNLDRRTAAMDALAQIDHALKAA